MSQEWITTAPNPRSRATGFDAGQRGWKLHCVEVIGDSFLRTGRMRAACGLRPNHGWSLDLFIEDRCKRCETAVERKSAAHLEVKRAVHGAALTVKDQTDGAA